jgi:hypothetical protein
LYGPAGCMACFRSSTVQNCSSTTQQCRTAAVQHVPTTVVDAAVAPAEACVLSAMQLVPLCHQTTTCTASLAAAPSHLAAAAAAASLPPPAPGAAAHSGAADSGGSQLLLGEPLRLVGDRGRTQPPPTAAAEHTAAAGGPAEGWTGDQHTPGGSRGQGEAAGRAQLRQQRAVLCGSKGQHCRRGRGGGGCQS